MQVREVNYNNIEVLRFLRLLKRNSSDQLEVETYELISFKEE